MTPTTTSMMQAALAYAERGWHVFPCHSIRNGKCTCGKECDSPGKHPRTLNGLKDATREPNTIQQWWAKWRHANIGVKTGEASGIVVIDVDTDDGKPGLETLQALESEHGQLPATVEAVTGSGGHHIVFAYPEGRDIRSRNGWKPGIAQIRAKIAASKQDEIAAPSQEPAIILSQMDETLKELQAIDDDHKFHERLDEAFAMLSMVVPGPVATATGAAESTTNSSPPSANDAVTIVFHGQLDPKSQETLCNRLTAIVDDENLLGSSYRVDQG